MSTVLFLGIFLGFVLAFFARGALAVIAIQRIRMIGFCGQCGREAPACLASVIDLETGERTSIVLCAPCHGYAKANAIERPPPWVQ